MGYKVLIVDDSKLARMSVARLLGALRPDWTWVEAANADEALARATESKVDVTLLDYNMPGRDGLELAAELRALSPEMPVAVISANSQTEIVARSQKVGAVFLSKPLGPQALDVFLTDAAVRLEAAGR